MVVCNAYRAMLRHSQVQIVQDAADLTDVLQLHQEHLPPVVRQAHLHSTRCVHVRSTSNQQGIGTGHCCSAGMFYGALASDMLHATPAQTLACSNADC